MFYFSNYSAESKYYDDLNKLVVGKIKHETDVVTIKKLLGLKSNVFSFLVNDCSEHKKAKCVNEIVIAAISHGEYKYVL